MILALPDILPADAVRQLRDGFQRVAFRDGQASAGKQAKLVKDNLQAIPGDPAAEQIKAAISDAIFRHEEFRLAARPKKIGPLILSRYEVGMEYGTHVDHPIMNHDLRRDVSFTLFLSEPETYDGGALVIVDAAGERAFRPSAGTLVIYPATTLHRVSAVTRGARLAAVGWAQSIVRDADKRELLYDLNRARLDLFDKYGKSENSDLLAKSAANLLRMWAEM